MRRGLGPFEQIVSEFQLTGIPRLISNLISFACRLGLLCGPRGVRRRLRKSHA